jgi:hypothetical protein
MLIDYFMRYFLYLLFDLKKTWIEKLIWCISPQSELTKV